MKYSLLVELYGKLEATSKRLEKTYLISEFLKKTPETDLPHITLLLQGRIFPAWDDNTIGVASRLVLKAINVATGIDQPKIEKEWKKTGDLGDTTTNLVGKKKQRTLFSKSLMVKKVFDNLRKLPEIEGEGTVDKKVQLIAELLTSAEPEEGKYIVRTVLEDLRVGVGDGTLRDAITWAYFEKEVQVNYDSEKKKIEPEDREKYKEVQEAVQKAYDLTADFGEVATQAMTKGLKGILALKLTIGKPVKVMLFQKAKDIEEAFERVGTPAAFEFKYDGFRCITGWTPIYTYKKGLISVKDVKKGDLVLTHKGRFKKVIALNKRKIDKKERLFRIQSFLGNEFRISEGHKVLVYRGGKLKWIYSQNLKKGESVAFPFPRFIIKEKPPIKKLKLKDTSNYTKTINISLDFFRFLGYWIGDGFTNEYHNTERVGIVFNKEHKIRIKKYTNIIKKSLQIDKISQSKQRGMTSVYWRDKPLRIWLSTYFRRDWKGKMLPSWFFNITKKQFLAFLEGWIDSDGHTDSKGRTSITTKEKDLAMFAQLIALKQGIVIAVKRIRIHGKNYYRLVLLKSQKHYRKIQDHVVVRLLKYEEVKRPDPRTSLYNLHVKGDNSYCTTLFALHNCQIHKSGNNIMIYTRRLDDVTTQFPDVVAYIKSHVKGDNFILDAEAVGYDAKTKKYLPFQAISQRIKRKYDIADVAKKFPVELNVFDLLAYENENLMNVPFKERRALIEKHVKNDPYKIVVAKQLVTSDAKKAETFYNQSLAEGEEGVMAKSLDSVYKPGSRVGFGVKVKPTMETLDLVIVGADWGEGKRSAWLSSYTLACKSKEGFVEIGKVGTGVKELAEAGGITFAEFTELLKPLIIDEKGKNVTVKPKIIVEIAFEEIQKSPTYSSGYALRFPRVIRERSDKGLADVSDIRVVERLFKEQRGR